MSADQLIQRQKKFYSSGITRDYHYRIDNLKKLKKDDPAKRESDHERAL